MDPHKHCCQYPEFLHACRHLCRCVNFTIDWLNSTTESPLFRSRSNGLTRFFVWEVELLQLKTPFKVLWVVVGAPSSEVSLSTSLVPLLLSGSGAAAFLQTSEVYVCMWAFLFESIRLMLVIKILSQICAKVLIYPQMSLFIYRKTVYKTETEL